mmetsp:Transcript_10022/g.36653  ORF Transcript_10022/g.36653 Transcript_10022/m.36653 type:complete len:531 (+) Transcript_10022:48-1640(+)|eukprot:scaffold3428_cov379-Prasinococcus_capsulatus_cf.AAC.3
MFKHAFSVALLAKAATAAPADELIESLPEFGPPPTPQYSGFLDASAAGDGVHLHYWYATTDLPDPSTAPTILWLNGGPGSSSIQAGWLQELGPLLITAEGKLVENPYAWTKVGNVLAIDSPAGVGYSYCDESLTGGGCVNTDNSTAAHTRAALQDFFSSKFPELAANPFFITGESYAGVYVPTLTREVLDNAPEINLVGIGVGDPCTDNESQKISMDSIWYSHKYGFLPDDQYDFLWNNCSARYPSLDMDGPKKGKWAIKSVAKPTMKNQSPECTLAMRKFLLASSKGLSQEWNHQWINDYFLYGPSGQGPNGPLAIDDVTAKYMMRDDVKKALHVESSPNKDWPGPSDKWSYTSQYAACNDNAPPGTPSMVDIYRYIAPKLQTTIVYNGDSDPCVTYEGTRNAVAKVGFPIVPGGDYRPWFFNMTAAEAGFVESKPLIFGPALSVIGGGSQFAGHIVNYENNLSFVTIHGSGHMVPQFRPRPALHFLKVLTSFGVLSPLTVPDDKMASMDDAEFSKYMDDWTVRAKMTI